MPMMAIFICDTCGGKKALQGNIANAIAAMEKRGWLAGKVVTCPECLVVPSAESPSPDKVTEVFSDGSCVGSNPGHGGWAWATATGGENGYSDTYPTTNQRMEIQAAVEALRAHQDPVHLYTDSRYVADCVNERWYQGWLRKNWKASGGKAVKNRDLWEDLIEQLSRHPNLTVEWVKGHADNGLNNKADELARAAAFEGKKLHEKK